MDSRLTRIFLFGDLFQVMHEIDGILDRPDIFRKVLPEGFRIKSRKEDDLLGKFPGEFIEIIAEINAEILELKEVIR